MRCLEMPINTQVGALSADHRAAFAVGRDGAPLNPVPERVTLIRERQGQMCLAFTGV